MIAAPTSVVVPTQMNPKAIRKDAMAIIRLLVPTQFAGANGAGAAIAM